VYLIDYVLIGRRCWERSRPQSPIFGTKRGGHFEHTTLYQKVRTQVYRTALDLAEVQRRKLPRLEDEPLPSCTCTVQTAYGILCLHTVHKRLRTTGYLLPEDFHKRWWYSQEEAVEAEASELDLLTSDEDPLSEDELEDIAIFNPAIVKGKGRPKGSKNKVKGAGITGEYRLYSLYAN
jgi:hypothetical protein